MWRGYNIRSCWTGDLQNISIPSFLFIKQGGYMHSNVSKVMYILAEEESCKILQIKEMGGINRYPNFWVVIIDLSSGACRWLPGDPVMIAGFSSTDYPIPSLSPRNTPFIRFGNGLFLFRFILVLFSYTLSK